ncbi:MAG: SDR family oxidoreductase [Propionibacteriaceae bacterium]|nr:SDR family oxidoreductase [Propionibacteriaceae bacterium]
MPNQFASVLVVIGVGGMGKAIARRLGAGQRVVLADFNDTILNAAKDELQGDGFDVTACNVDVSKAESMTALASAAAQLGPVMQVVHTAGLSPTMAPTEAILNVDLLGVALMLDTFPTVIHPGGAGVVIASMAGHTASLYHMLAPEDERALATTPTDQLLTLPCVTPSALNPGTAYSLAKRANQVRVQAAARTWGAKGARINSISPGIIATPMGQQELASESGAQMRAMISGSATGRLGTPSDIAAATAFLLSQDAAFITGTDVLVDGGVIASMSA